MPQNTYPLGFFFRSTTHKIEKIMNRKLKSMGLTKSQCDVLFFIAKNKENDIIQRDIENYFHISNPTVTGILNRLEQKGYIVREQSKKDKRIHRIRSTFDEEELCAQFTKQREYVDQILTKGLSDEEKAQLTLLLEKVMNNVIEEAKEEKNDKDLTLPFERVQN